MEFKKIFEPIISKNILDKVIYIPNDCRDIWEWSEKVYNFIEDLQK